MRIRSIALAVALVAPAALAQPAKSNKPVTQQSEASYFNRGQNGHTKTTSGKPVQPNSNTAASSTLPLGTKATVTDKATGKSTRVQVTDRGPVRRDRMIDLSRKAAGEVGMSKSGVAPVAVQADPNKQTNPAVRQQLLNQPR